MDKYDGYRTKTVSTHSRLKAAGSQMRIVSVSRTVSTHSRLKAAGMCMVGFSKQEARFNTQPPEGGW